MAEIVLEGLSKEYTAGIPAVQDLDLAIAEGEFVVLVGPSGCGKTTTLRLIAGLETATGGVIRINGQAVQHLPPRQRDLAMVFQRPVLYPHLRVRDNLAMGLRLHQSNSWWGGWLLPGSKKRRLCQQKVVQQRVADAARLLKLDHLLDRRPNQLSGGEQQRVALGRALARQPAAFLLDEPLSNLDARLREEMRRELHLLHRRLPATMIYVTHDQGEAMTLGDRIVVLQGGRIQQTDCPAGLYHRPANRFVASFIGWPPMNFLDGHLRREGDQVYFVTEGWSVPLPGNCLRNSNNLDGTWVTMGIRPNHISLIAIRDVSKLVSSTFLRMQVSWIEDLGGVTLVTCERGHCQLTIQCSHSKSRWRDGDIGEVALNMDHVHWFDGFSGKALSHPDFSGG